MARSKGRGELLAIGEYINRTIEELEEAFKNREKRGSSGISTGFLDLDEKIGGGYKPGQLIVIAGRPGMGKTAIALNSVEDLALRQGLAAGIFSMEMHATELVKRQLAGMAKVHGLRLSHGRIDDTIWNEIGKAAPKLHKAPIFLCEDGYLSISEITAGTRKLKRQAPNLGMIVVDYLGLMRIERPSSNRAQDLAEISRGLKALAKELAIPVVLLAQLNREVEKRGDKRPVLSDLRDSGEIEADADIVLMLYREAVYRELEDSNPDKARAEVLIRKQRNGPTGKVYLHYADWCTRFSDWNPL
jgi:replicative DNA helicase